MEEDAYVRLIREIEVERGRMTTHEAVCAERYKGIAADLSDLKGSAAMIATAVSKQGGVWDKRVIAAMSAIGMLLVGIIGWEGSQLYQLEPLRHHTSDSATP